jgi:hypothetical protein
MTTATLIELPIEDRIQNTVAIFKKQDAAIAAMKAECLSMKIAGVEDREGYTKVYESRQTAKRLRVAVGKKAKAMKEDALRDGKMLAAAITEEDKRITAELEAIEDYLQKQEDEYEAAKEVIKAAKAAAAQAALQKRIDRLTEARCALPGIDFLRDIDAENFELYFAKAVERQAEAERLEKIEAERIAAEQAAEKAEQDRQEAEYKIECERKANEQRAELARQAEANRIEAERLKEIEKQIKANRLAEEKRQEESNRIERERMEAERAELKRQADELRAAQEAERLRVEAENAERQRVRNEELRNEMEAAEARRVVDAAEALQRLRNAEEAATALELWERKMLYLVCECMKDQERGLDVLVSAAWDCIVQHWRTRPQL